MTFRLRSDGEADEKVQWTFSSGEGPKGRMSLTSGGAGANENGPASLQGRFGVWVRG